MKFELLELLLRPKVGWCANQKLKGMILKADNGKQVKVQFVGQLEDGTVFSQASAEKPLEFTLGKENLIPGFVEAVRGMEPGQQKTVQLAPEDAFGQYDPKKLVTLSRKQFAKHEPIKSGMDVDVKDVSGQEFSCRVNSCTEDSVTVDTNHPLAGQTLRFGIRLQEVA